MRWAGAARSRKNGRPRGCAIQCIDLTTLAGDDTPARVRRLCAKARRPLRDDIVEALGLAEAPPTVGAVCVYPTMVAPAVKALAGSGIPVASVATGFPAGLIPLPQGVDKIAFTGSTEIGRAIREATAGSGKKLTLELGGKSPFVVFEDADLDGAVEGGVDAIWFNGGQVCCAGSRLLVQEGAADAFFTKLKRRMAALRVGDPLDKSIDMGAIVAPVQLQRIRDLVAKGVSEGASLHQSGVVPAKGCFYPPTLLTDVAPASTVAQVEKTSASNLKATWTSGDSDWFSAAQGQGPEYLRRATQVKTIWAPYGE